MSLFEKTNALDTVIKVGQKKAKDYHEEGALDEISLDQVFEDMLEKEMDDKIDEAVYRLEMSAILLSNRVQPDVPMSDDEAYNRDEPPVDFEELSRLEMEPDTPSTEFDVADVHEFDEKLNDLALTFDLLRDDVQEMLDDPENAASGELNELLLKLATAKDDFINFASYCGRRMGKIE